jgi:serine protease Do
MSPPSIDGARRRALLSRTALLLLRACGAILASSLVLADAPSPQLQHQVRLATFEVVLKKPDKETVTYEKPLPLELIPFVQRTDGYWPIGTAFAIGPNTFVTAAHVLGACVGAQFGAPGIRDSDNHVYVIDKVLKYSDHEDYAVFSVQSPPAVTPLVPNARTAADDAVFAVGNALGEGIVIRDGLLTSFTPEAQDGKWKWLRFSAAASPGNSGGPLLDAQGRVIGVVEAKSPSENLNYALPIDNVLNGSDKQAVLAIRQSFGFPKLLRGTVVGELKDGFPLPLSFPEFGSRLQDAQLRYWREQEARLAASLNDDIFPHGQSATLLARLYSSEDPALVAQSDDGAWDVRRCSGNATTLPGDGRVWHCLDATGIALFRLTYPDNSTDPQRYHDSKAFLDMLLKGTPLPRMVGTQAVRITSLGPARRESVVRDRYGRVWQQRVYSMGYIDAYFVTLAMATPDGYIGMANLVPSALLDLQAEQQRFVADYVYLTYTGTLAQWQAFLALNELRPSILEHDKLTFSAGGPLSFESARLRLDSGGIMTVTAQSTLSLQMTYLLERGALVWDVGGITLTPGRDPKTFLAAYRQPKPSADAGREWRDRWEHMSRREGEFTGAMQHDEKLTDFWIRTVAGNPALPELDRPLYEVVYTTDRALQPREMEDIRTRLATTFKITE